MKGRCIGHVHVHGQDQGTERLFHRLSNWVAYRNTMSSLRKVPSLSWNAMWIQWTNKDGQNHSPPSSLAGPTDWGWWDEGV